MTLYDVAIVGAGPAGCAAAINAARQGLTVIVIDKATFPRDKTCGDGLTTSALRYLHHLGFDPSVVPSWRAIDKTTWRDPLGHSLTLPVPDDGGTRIAVARRYELDNALVHLTRASGVVVHTGTPLLSTTVGPNGGQLTTPTGVIEARFIIGADGAYSPLRRQLQPTAGQYLGDIHAFRQYFRNVDGPAADQLWVSFEPEILPGYFWSFPLGDGSTNVGFGIERGRNISVQSMKDIWPRLLASPHVAKALGPSAEPEERHRAWPIPARLTTANLVLGQGRVLFVGDAARCVDPLTGEGIGQALETGMLATTCIAEGQLSPEQVETLYRKHMRRGMVIDHHFARGLSRVVRYRAGAVAAIRLAPLGPQRGRYAMRWVFEDNPRAGLLTPWRWKQRFKPKPPVYT